MFGFGKKKKQTPFDPVGADNDLQEFSFIWYEKMNYGDTTYYTKPFRTKVKAKNREEAAIKLQNFVMQKMVLVWADENKYNKTDRAKFDEYFKGFDDIFADFDKTFQSFEKIFGKPKE